MERYIYNIVGLLLLFTGCNVEPPHYSEELLQLESRVDAVPDSVYSRLDSFDTGKMYEADRALFITIRTEAADKLYKEHTTDSLIAEAVKFFEKKHDTPRLAKAWYLAGRIHSDWKEWEEAMNDFLKAQLLTDDSNDYMLRARIASYLGNINWRNRLYLKARYHHQESLQYYTHAKDTTGIASALKCIGETFMAKYQTDSAACFYKQALLMAGITQNKRLLGNIHNCLGYLYKESQQTNQALSELRSAICYSPSNYSIYKDIGSLFIQMGELDSACYYLEQALLSDKLPTRCMANYYLGEVASLKGDSKRAFDYKKKYEQLSDSLFLEKKTEELSGIQQQVLGKKRVNKLMSKQVLLNISIVVLIVLFIAFILIKREKKRRYILSKSESDLFEKEQKFQETKSTVNKNSHQIQLNHIYQNRCKADPFMKQLYKKTKLPVFTSLQWKQFANTFDEIYIGFTKQIKMEHPTLSPRELQICQLSIMGIKVSRIADLTGGQSDSISTYKQKMKAKYFNGKGKLEDSLLNYLEK